MALDSELLWEGECQACGGLECEFCRECRNCHCDCEEALLQMEGAQEYDLPESDDSSNLPDKESS